MSKNNGQKYNGWKNYDTWNVSLWISNDYGLYLAARDFMRRYKGRAPYRDFICRMDLEGKKTPDGARWDGSSLGYAELNGMMRELIG